MSFNYSGYSIADIGISGISGRAGIGVSQLGFSIDFRFPLTAMGVVTVRDVQVEVHATFSPGGAAGSYLGMAVPEVPFEVTTAPGNDRRQLLFWLSLVDGQLFELERMRVGRDIRFELKISALANGEHGVWPQNDTVQRAVNVSDWAKILVELKGPEYLVIGVGLPRCTPEHPLASAVELIRHAHSALVVGRFDTVVADCRRAIESTIKATGEHQELQKLAELPKSSKHDLSKLQRELLLLDAVRRYTHLAHHVDQQGRPEYYSRDDANMLLAMTSSLIASRVLRGRG